MRIAVNLNFIAYSTKIKRKNSFKYYLTHLEGRENNCVTLHVFKFKLN